ncbi:unnamed protein product [Clonostachys solani]|uniref:Developmental regulatory protein wetA n=1 Tax=Clonostachys solani TaxID=160281 RepID=A0A9N9ZDC4_9HYPO|nr:unnamed protein product [Clonostachys solani]
MGSWGMPYRIEGGERDPNYFSWQDNEGGATDDTNDLFGQYVDLDNLDMQGLSFITTSTEPFALTSTVPRNTADPFLIDQPPESIDSSTTDELDFLSNSSQVGPPASATHNVNSGNFIATENELPGETGHELVGRNSISDTELPRLEGISLSSPTKKNANTSVSQPTSPTPPRTANRKPNSFIQAVGATLRKATNRVKNRKPLPDRPGSPTFEMQINAPRTRPRQADLAVKTAPISPPIRQGVPDSFIHGSCEDPFADMPSMPPQSNMRYLYQESVSPTTIEPPSIDGEGTPYPLSNGGTTRSADSSWDHHQQHHSGPMSSSMNGQQWNAGGMMVDPSTNWWDYTGFQDAQNMHQKNAEMNFAVHAQQAELPYKYASLPDTSTSGLMIQMPQARPPQNSVGELKMTAQTHLPPPPPVPATERPHRPPRAPSSGARYASTSRARHPSCSPVRKPRAPSASPTRTPGHPQSRHSSGGSISSVRSASCRLPGSMPGTPCSVRKRRSREPSGSGEIGFVNFTPHDGTVLMTGVAPSGSSKTKARREKEALERRRKLSEAAIKAVAAAGGDVERLMQQGFAI